MAGYCDNVKNYINCEQVIQLEARVNGSSNFFLKMANEMDGQHNELLPWQRLYCFVNTVTRSY